MLFLELVENRLPKNGIVGIDLIEYGMCGVFAIPWTDGKRRAVVLLRV